MAITDFFAWSKSLKNDGDIYFMHDDEDAALLWSPIPDGQIYVKLTPIWPDMTSSPWKPTLIQHYIHITKGEPTAHLLSTLKKLSFETKN